MIVMAILKFGGYEKIMSVLREFIDACQAARIPENGCYRFGTSEVFDIRGITVVVDTHVIRPKITVSNERGSFVFNDSSMVEKTIQKIRELL